jgi:hypothetical protein
VTAVTEIKVKAGNAVTVKVHGPAVVRIEPGGKQPDHPTEGGATMEGLAEAVALLAGRIQGIGLSGDVPP